MFINRPSHDQHIHTHVLPILFTGTSHVDPYSANLLSVTRCNLSFGTRGFHTAAATIWNSLPANVSSSETLNIWIWPRTGLCGGCGRHMALRNLELHARNYDDDECA